jgi:hypothetical protein
MRDFHSTSRESATIHLTPHWHRSASTWALDRRAPDEVRLAAMIALAEIEATCADAAAVMNGIGSDDPTGLALRHEARNAVWSTSASEIMPQTSAILRRVRASREIEEARQINTIDAAFVRLNAPTIRAERRKSRADLLGIAAAFVAAAVLLWMGARVAEGLPQTLAVAEYMRGM